MYTKLSSVMALLITAIVLLAACQRQTTTESDCPKAEVLCVGLVTGLGGVNDKSFNQSAWEGVEMAQSEKVANEVRYIETIDAKDFEKNVATLVDAGYDIIVTVGAPDNRSNNQRSKKICGHFFCRCKSGPS